MKINNKLQIVETKNFNNNSELIDIVIKKGAFGSGEHETTKACLEIITDLDVKNKTILDIGCGTGILSIAAAKFGSKKVIGFDPEFSACLTSKKNIELNDLDNIDIICSFNDAVKGKYDVVLANVYYYVLLDISKYIKEIIKNGGFLILSGIPFSENFDVRNAYNKLGFITLKNMFHEEFTTVLMKLDI
jgi:ribosomal protein L11 methyltransferase